MLTTRLIVSGGVVLLVVTVFKVPLATLLLLGAMLLCPLMMLGMHGRGHEHGGDKREHGTAHDHSSTARSESEGP